MIVLYLINKMKITILELNPESKKYLNIFEKLYAIRLTLWANIKLNMRTTTPILLTFIVLFFSCNSVETKNEKQLIKDILIDMWDAIEKGDIDRYASYVHDDFTQFGEYDSVLRSGKAAEIKGIKKWIESSTPIHTEMHKPSVTINGNTAFITYYWSDSGSTNGKAFATKGKSTRIFIKENGKWFMYTWALHLTT